MKKIIVLMILLALIGCREEPRKVVKKPVVEEEIEVKVEIEYVENDQLKEMVKLANEKTEVIDVSLLHDRLSRLLLIGVDLEIDIEVQEDLIDDIIVDELYNWKVEMVREMLSEEGVSLNQDDFDTLVARTSVSDAYKLMSVYETIYLKKQVN
jgi:hypothetical protein